MPKAKAKADDQLKVTLVKSTIGSIPKHKLTVKALGLRKIGSSNVLKNNDATLGMINQVRHLIKVESI